MYSYCNNNPVLLRDSTGTRPIDSLSVRSETREQKKQSFDYMNGKNSNDNTPLRDVTDEINAVLLPTADNARISRTVLDKIDVGGIKGGILVYPVFAALVFHKSVWDIKRERPWRNTIDTDYPGAGVPITYNDNIVTVEYLGNYTYGFIGYSCKIPLVALYVGSYVAAGFPRKEADLENEFGDWNAIYAGYYDAKRYFCE